MTDVKFSMSRSMPSSPRGRSSLGNSTLQNMSLEDANKAGVYHASPSYYGTPYSRQEAELRSIASQRKSLDAIPNFDATLDRGKKTKQEFLLNPIWPTVPPPPGQSEKLAPTPGPSRANAARSFPEAAARATRDQQTRQADSFVRSTSDRGHLPLASTDGPDPSKSQPQIYHMQSKPPPVDALTQISPPHTPPLSDTANQQQLYSRQQKKWPSRDSSNHGSPDGILVSSLSFSSSSSSSSGGLHSPPVRRTAQIARSTPQSPRALPMAAQPGPARPPPANADLEGLVGGPLPRRSPLQLPSSLSSASSSPPVPSSHREALLVQEVQSLRSSVHALQGAVQGIVSSLQHVVQAQQMQLQAGRGAGGGGDLGEVQLAVRRLGEEVKAGMAQLTTLVKFKDEQQQARLLNLASMYDSDFLVPLPTDKGHIPGNFPTTRQSFAELSDEAALKLVQHYGLPVDPEHERKERLARFIGLR